MWKNLHPDKKTIYRQKAEALKLEYQKNPEAGKKKSKPKKKPQPVYLSDSESEEPAEMDLDEAQNAADKRIEMLLSALVDTNQALNAAALYDSSTWRAALLPEVTV